MTSTAAVSRVNGPLLEVQGLSGIAVADLLRVGTGRLLAEVVREKTGTITAQSYEYTGGIAPGDPVEALHRPLAARLAPGLLGGSSTVCSARLAAHRSGWNPGRRKPSPRIHIGHLNQR